MIAAIPVRRSAWSGHWHDVHELSVLQGLVSGVHERGETTTAKCWPSNSNRHHAFSRNPAEILAQRPHRSLTDSSGRTYECNQPLCRNQKTLASRGPSTHDPPPAIFRLPDVPRWDLPSVRLPYYPVPPCRVGGYCFGLRRAARCTDSSAVGQLFDEHLLEQDVGHLDGLDGSPGQRQEGFLDPVHTCRT